MAQLDFSSLERHQASYVADDLRERGDDVIWRVRFGEGWLHVYLLIEFQSTVDRAGILRSCVIFWWMKAVSRTAN